jgi:hypothetical protein
MKINHKIKSLFLLSLVGSTSAKEENSKNQSEINLNSLPQLSANLTEGEGNSSQALLFFAGYPISLGVETYDGSGKKWRKYSTAGFVVVNTNSSKCSPLNEFGNDYGGFLTSSFGWPPQWLGGSDSGTSIALSDEVYSWDGLTPLGNFGSNGYTNLNYGNTHQDIDYTYVSNTEYYGAWDTKLTPYVVGGSDDESNESKLQLYPVTGLGSVTIGSKICAYGAVSGYLCGNLTEINIGLAIPTPGKTTDLITLVSLNKVDLGVNGFYGEEDLGGPVYTVSNIGDRTIAQALGHITYFDNNDPNHKLLYYTPIDKALEGILGDYSCSYSLLTYNETNAQEYQELLAQVEIPAKK